MISPTSAATDRSGSLKQLGDLGRRCLSAILEPRSVEKVRLNGMRWQELLGSLKAPQQALGRSAVSCGATHSVMEKCNFACTSCYLSARANATPPLSFIETKQQLDTLRRELGPAGKAQITSGEVTLLPVQDLGRIVAYARRIGLDPMVMTNGERFLEEPNYLPTLVRDYGLEKVSIHIDTTQRGRKGMPNSATEEDIHPIRDRFASMLREVRARTGSKLHAAQTVTVTEKNIDEIPTIMRWALDNVDAFRMISFQPSAAVGRTQDRRTRSLTLDAVWKRVCAGVGRPLNRHAMHFGHPQCNIICPVVVVSFAGRYEVIECARPGDHWDLRIMKNILQRFGGFTVVGARPFESALRLVSMLVRNLGFLAEGLAYGLYRLWGIRAWLPATVFHLLMRGKVRVCPLAIIVHRFMSPDELNTPLGRERLNACAFKVPVGGKMISMCEMNATDLRTSLNEAMASRQGSKSFG